MTRPQIDNEYYHGLGDRWWTAKNDPIALLRAESRLKNRWIQARIETQRKPENTTLLDIGCGAGFLTVPFSEAGYAVTGIDLSAESLEVAKARTPSPQARYLQADACKLPFENESFDVVTCLDFLEHVETPGAVIREASRVLKPGGLFFFHTFNRTLRARLLVIELVRLLVPNTPWHLHVAHLFLKPEEVASFCKEASLEPEAWTGLAPRLFKRSVLNGILKREVPDDFEFQLTRDLSVSYLGVARKHGP